MVVINISKFASAILPGVDNPACLHQPVGHCSSLASSAKEEWKVQQTTMQQLGVAVSSSKSCQT